ncbi:MAG: Ppx/GppA family phosphatase [Proteobacteria bacterium]|nr:Ppx/GppA family phosphatase [Pseudomonadota bacterium]
MALRRFAGKRRRELGQGGVPVVAAIDLGTNNCRLLVGTQSRSGNLRVVDSFSRIVKLGEGLAESGELSQAAIERAVAALKICAARLHKNRVHRVRAIATEACRRARNVDVLLERVASEAGIALEIVSSDEEARIASVGCAPLMDSRYEGALIFDIGGGSTEVIWMRGSHGAAKVVHAASVPIGVVTLFETTDKRRPAYLEMVSELLPAFAQISRAMKEKGAFGPKTHHLLGTSGTVTTLAAVALGLERYERKKVDASWHACERILGVVDELVSLDHAGRAKIACIGEERAELVVPGCAIFSAIHAQWPCAQLRVADRGLREGMLRELMADARA